LAGRLLESLETFFNGIAPHFSNLNLKVIEQPLIPDVNLRGVTRFATRLGSIIAVLEPQNQMLTSKVTPQNATTLDVQFTSKWFTNWATPGSDGRYLQSIVQIGNEFNRLVSVDTENKTVDVEEGVLQRYPKNTNIDLYGFPITTRLVVAGTDHSEGSSSSGIPPTSMTVEVRSLYPIANNDVILLEIRRGSISFYEYKVLTATTRPKVTEDDTEMYVYYLELDDTTDFINKVLENEGAQGMSFVNATNSYVYVKGYPLFESRQIVMPLMRDREQAGPFCVDHMSGQLLANTIPVEDYMNIKLETVAGTYLHGFGSEDTYKTISKNTSVPNCITGDKFALWPKFKGHIALETTKVFNFIPDHEGESGIKVDIEPNIRVPGRWETKFFADPREQEDVHVLIQLYPNDPLRYIIPANPIGFTVAVESVDALTALTLGVWEDSNTFPPLTGRALGDTYIVQDEFSEVNGLFQVVGSETFKFWTFIQPKYGSVYSVSESEDYKYYRYYRQNDQDDGSWEVINNGHDIEKIIITTRSQYPVKMGPWELTDSQVKFLHYQLLSHVFGRNWQSSGLVVKPLMKSTINLEGDYDTARYNNGYVHGASKSLKPIGAESWSEEVGNTHSVEC
jgi:hypothetical protein